MSRSPIYSNIHVYRFVLNLIYAGRYRERFEDVIAALPPGTRRVTEVCFGDIRIAEYCRDAAVAWVGYDINERFVDFARRHGFDAREADILTAESLAPADVCIMIGSLYHFHEHCEALLGKLLGVAPCVLLSEPVRNLSSLPGPVGFVARRMANAGKGHEEFRFGEASLCETLDRLSRPLRFRYDVISRKRDMLVRIQAVAR